MTSLTRKFIEVDGATLEIFRGGTGRPLVCCSHPHSADDFERYRWYSEYIHEGIPNSELLVLENSGHGEAGVDVRVFRETALRFLAQLAD